MGHFHNFLIFKEEMNSIFLVKELRPISSGFHKTQIRNCTECSESKRGNSFKSFQLFTDLFTDWKKHTAIMGSKLSIFPWEAVLIFPLLMLSSAIFNWTQAFPGKIQLWRFRNLPMWQRSKQSLILVTKIRNSCFGQQNITIFWNQGGFHVACLASLNWYLVIIPSCCGSSQHSNGKS